MGYRVESAELVMKPVTFVEVEEDVRAKIERLLEQLEELDEVQRVWSNYA